MPYRVALIIETSTSYGRGLLAGIVRYMRVNQNWSIFLDQQDLTKAPPDWLKDWRGDGIISRVRLPAEQKGARKANVRIVELTDRHDGHVIPHVRSDDEQIGRLAAKHLLERGFQRFGFCGFEGESWSKRRELAFAGAVADAGFDCSIYTSRWYGESAPSWEQDIEAVREWIKGLVPPIGIMCSNDLRGHRVLDACASLGLSVPEKIAVVGVDNDELLCGMCVPPLSSVQANAQAVGFHAAEILGDLMSGAKRNNQTLIVPPIGVKTRQSTDVVAVEDRDLSCALQFIRQHACSGICVDDVTRHAPLSRSKLERQFRKLLGRTPQQEIRSVQVKRVCELIASTDLAFDQIAMQCGFENPEYMYVVFRRIVGMTPGDYRRQANPT